MSSKNYIVTILMGILIFIVIMYSTILFSNTVNQELEHSVRSNLSDMADQQQLALNRQLDSMIFSVTSIAETLPIIGVQETNILEYIAEKQLALNIDTALVIDVDGLAFLPNQKFADVSQTDYFKASIDGEIYASKPHTSLYSGNEVITVSAPIYVNDIVDGVLAVEYTTAYLETLLTSFTDERGLNLVVDSGSEIMLSTANFDLSFDAFKNADFEEGATFESILEDFSNTGSGSLKYTLFGQTKFAEYRSLNVNDWSLFFEISEESLTQSVDNISRRMLMLSASIILAALITIIYIITSKNNAAKLLEQAAYYDELTGLPNMIKLKMLINQTINKYPKKSFSIVKFDIVNFKAINELFGYDSGNKVINAIAQTGKTVLHKHFIQSRVNAEEFILFCESDFFKDLHESSLNYESLFTTLLPEMEDHKFAFRYGRYKIKPGETDVNDIINKVTMAHSFAKNNTTSNIWDYDANFTKKILRDTEIANKMHKALDNKEFKVYLQPKYGIENGKIIGAEALVRWVQPDGTLIYPGEFIPLFEQNGFIAQLDKYMLKSVCEILKSWKDAGEKCLTISVNFSRIHINNKNFVQEISNIVKSYGVDLKYIEIELTESTIIENEKELKGLLKDLHNEGFLLSIDDFGSGYSSLGMLKNFKVDTLKLDRSFFIETENEDEHSRGNIVVENIINLASNLGMYTVAEGIEDKNQEEFLRKIKCDAAQGYFFSRPVPVNEFEKIYFSQ